MRFVFALMFAVSMFTTNLHANGFKSWQVCGGSPMSTCAAASLSVTGTTVTLKVWNMSGKAGTYAGTVFNRIGIYNIPTAVNAVGLTSVNGTVRAGDGVPGPWAIQNNAPAGFSSVDVVSSMNQSLGGIASACAGALLPAPNAATPNYFVTPCGSNANTPVTFTFTVNQNFNPSSADVVFRGYDVRNPTTVSECHTGPYTDPHTGQVVDANCYAAPEPMTMTLLGTGLAGLGIVSLRKRKTSK